MRRLLIAVLCAVSFATQAQISPAVTAALVPSPLGIVLTVGQWVMQDRRQVYYIQVQAPGASFEQARQNAFRLAVEQAVGTLILSETESRDSRLRRDEIITYASGFVDRFEVLRSEITATGYVVTMDVWVGRSQIAQRLMNAGATTGAIDGTRLATQADTLRHERAQGDRVMAAVLSDFPRRAFDVQLARTQVTFTDRRQVQIDIPVTIRWNQDYVRAFYEAAKAVGREPERCVFSRECAENQAGLHHLWIKGRGTIMGWNGWVGFDDWARVQAIVTRVTQHRPALQITIYDTAGHRRFESCQPFLLSNLESPASGHRPARYMLTIQDRMITLDERYAIEGTRWVNFGFQNTENLDRIDARVVDTADCARSR
jgi:hypothetical protein